MFFFFSGIRLSWDKDYGTILTHISLLCCLYFNHQSAMFNWIDSGSAGAVMLPFPVSLQSCSRLNPPPCSPAPGWSHLPAGQRAPRPQHHPSPAPLCPCDALWWEGGRCVLSLPGRVQPPCPGAVGCVPITTCSSPGDIPVSCLCQCPWCWSGLVPTLWQPWASSPCRWPWLAPSEAHICFPAFNKSAGDCPLTLNLFVFSKLEL